MPLMIKGAHTRKCFSVSIHRFCDYWPFFTQPPQYFLKELTVFLCEERAHLFWFIFVSVLTICFDFEERLPDWLIFSKFVLMSSRTTKNQNKCAHSSQKKICRGCMKKCVKCLEKNVNSHRICEYLRKKTYVYKHLKFPRYTLKKLRTIKYKKYVKNIIQRGRSLQFAFQYLRRFPDLIIIILCSIDSGNVDAQPTPL